MGVKSWLVIARDYRAVFARAIELNFSGRGLGDTSSRLACHLEDWGVQARRTEGREKPAKGVERASGRAA
jgi:hypothetical protein